MAEDLLARILREIRDRKRAAAAAHDEYGRLEDALGPEQAQSAAHPADAQCGGRGRGRRRGAGGRRRARIATRSWPSCATVPG